MALRRKTKPMHPVIGKGWGKFRFTGKLEADCEGFFRMSLQRKLAPAKVWFIDRAFALPVGQ